MKKIILIQPKSGSWDIIGVRLPISLLSIATLPIKNGYDVEIIDQRIDKDWKRKLLNHLKDEPMLVGTTSMTGIQIKYALDISKIVKENSNATMVWGGQHATLFPEQTLENKYIDVIVKGEGEIAFMDIVKNNIKTGIIERPFVDLNTLPDIPYHLINLDNYKGGVKLSEKPSICISTSRGCPYTCSFCASPILNRKKFRGISPKNVIRKIKYIIDKFGITDIYFQEDNMCGNPKRFQKIINLLIKEKLNINWGTLGIRADTLNKMKDSMFSKIYESGCRALDIGIEFGSQRMLDLINKKETIEDFIKLNNRLNKFNFTIKYTFICGYPTETDKEIGKSVNLALKLVKDNKSVYTLFSTATAYAGTEFFNLAVKHGLKIPERLEDWIEYDQTNVTHNSHSWLSKRQLKMCNNLAFTSMFANKNILSNKITTSNSLHRLLFKLYHPIAKYRFENNFYHCLIEQKLFNILS